MKRGGRNWIGMGLGLAVLWGCVTVPELEGSPPNENVPEDTRSEDLRDLQILSDDEGIIVGTGGLILRTQFGGSLWEEVFSGTDETLNSVRFDALHQEGWVVGNHGTVLHSRNRGATWQPEISGARENLHALSVPVYDSMTHEYMLWAVGDNGTILYSNDSGLSWYPQQSMSIRHLREVVITGSANSVSGWIFGDGGTILRMAHNDGFWAPDISPTDRNLYAAYFKSPNDGWVVGDFGTILHYQGQQGWVLHQTIATERLNGVFFNSRDPKCGWIVGGGGRVIQTEDSGGLWLPRKTDFTDDFYAAYFIKPRDPVVCRDIGWVIGDNGLILHSIDGGFFWRKQPIRWLD